MAVKTVIVEQPSVEEKSVVETGQVGGGSLASMILSGSGEYSMFQTEEVSNTGLGLPDLRFHWSIQQDLDNPNHFNLWEGQQYQPLQAGWIVSAIACRDVIKREYKNDKGEPRNEYLYPGKNTGERYAELLPQVKQDPSLSMGRKYILAINVDNIWRLASFTATKSMNDYTGFLLTSRFQNRVGQEIEIANHKSNFVASKNDARKTFPDKMKFTQKKKIELEESDIVAISQLVNSHSAAFETFMNA